MKTFYTLLLGICMLFGKIEAQRCGTESPSLSLPFHQWFNKTSAIQAKNKVNVLRIIPVVVHVIYRRENSDHNISDAQIQSQIDILNADYSGQSGGTDSEIQFCLAGQYFLRVVAGEKSLVKIVLVI